MIFRLIIKLFTLHQYHFFQEIAHYLALSHYDVLLNQK